MKVEWLGRVAYDRAAALQEQIRHQVLDGGEERLLLLEHDPVVTLGRGAKAADILDAASLEKLGVTISQSSRGGQVTYHGPGQIVAYPLLDLRRLKLGVRELVHRIEQALIDTLAEWNIAGVRRQGAPGVYVGDAKIAALGLRVRRGCTFHGLAFNVAMDLAPFHRINPCGYAGLQVTQMLDLGGPSRLADVEDVLIVELGREFGLSPQEADPVLPRAAA